MIRQFRESDRPQVAALWRTVFHDDPPWNDPDGIIDRKLAFQPEFFYVFEEGEAISGAVLAGYDGHRGWIYHLAVTSPRRRHGIGRALVRRVEEDLAALGCVKINLQIRAANKAARGFYEKLGYAVEDHLNMGRLL